MIGTLLELAERDPRTVFLTADLGYLFVEPFAQRFPERFFNVGVAEQNMVGVATGLAEGGFIPYVYSIATFAALRPYEFIRNGPVLQRLPVRIIGVGGGFEYDHAGPTHYALEDVGALRMLPGLRVIAPADAAQCRSAVLALHDDPGPAYFRLGKDDVYRVPGLEGRFESGRLQVVREGADALFLALGPAARSALAAADLLAERGVASTVAVISSVSPAPEADLLDLLSSFPFAVTVEGHYAVGGLGSLACEVAAEHGLACRITRCGVTEAPTGAQGSQAFMNRLHGISPERIAAAAWDRLGDAPSARRPAGDWAPAREPSRSAPVASPLRNPKDT